MSPSRESDLAKNRGRVNRARSAARQLYRALLDLVLPPCCVVCGKVETWLCDPCAERLPFVSRPSCPRCANAYDGPGVCSRCRSSPLQVAPVTSVFLFQDAVREAIYALKYHGGASVAIPLAGRMAEAWGWLGLSSDLLVPVPLHSERERQRGYNQSVVLARSLAPLVEVPLDETILFRTRATVSQTHLGTSERWDNVRDAFACSGSRELSGLRVTLVDDVMTTGATLNACAVALRARGARSVSAFTLAHAV